jgi:hypothetical protein
MKSDTPFNHKRMCSTYGNCPVLSHSNSQQFIYCSRISLMWLSQHIIMMMMINHHYHHQSLIHTLTARLPKSYFNILCELLISKLTSSGKLLQAKFLMYFLFASHMLNVQSISTFLIWMHPIILHKQWKQRSSMLCKFLYSATICSLLGLNSLLTSQHRTLLLLQRQRPQHKSLWTTLPDLG